MTAFPSLLCCTRPHPVDALWSVSVPQQRSKLLLRRLRQYELDFVMRSRDHVD